MEKGVGRLEIYVFIGGGGDISKFHFIILSVKINTFPDLNLLNMIFF